MRLRQPGFVAAAMLAFAGNSLLCRLALRSGTIDPATFTAIRLAAGALVLWAIMRVRGLAPAGSWASATVLFAYAAAFSFAYAGLPTGTGALLLFGAVQATMIGHALWCGERLGGWQFLGLLAAAAGLVLLLLPGLSAPSPLHAGLMLGAGAAWGVYSLRGRVAGNPTAATAGNFLRATPMALVLAVVAGNHGLPGLSGSVDAVLSGAGASGLGYAIWYAALPGLRATVAATVQLSVPVLAAFGAVLLLDEAVTLRLLASTVAILGGIALVILARSTPAPPRPPPLTPAR